jgi:hypothetical protein
LPLNRSAYTDFFKRNFREPEVIIPAENKSTAREDPFKTPYALANAAMHKKRALKSARKLKPTAEVWAVVNGLEYLTPETIKILTQRGQQWHDAWPIGEPMASRRDNYQFVIHSNQVAEMLQISIRKAQDLLAACRLALGKDENGYVSVKEFCHLQKFDEEDFRKALNCIAPDFKTKS